MRRPAAAILALLGPVAAIMAPAQPSFLAAVAPRNSSLIDVVGGRRPNRITPQLVMTAKAGTLDDLPERTLANVHRTLALNPELMVRFLNDSECAEFIGRNYGADLLSAFSNERVGAYKGDICRAAVVAVEGGFYADLDVQFRVPFSELVDPSTTFMSAFDSFCNLWNAIFAAEPGSVVMKAVMESMVAWYKKDHLESELMGTHTFYQGLEKAVASECPLHCGPGIHPSCGLRWKAKGKLQFKCGRESTIRLYREKPLTCGKKATEECPQPRMEGFYGLRFGIYEPGVGGNLVGWSRFENCTDFGCNQRRKAPERRAVETSAPTQQDLAPSHCG